MRWWLLTIGLALMMTSPAALAGAGGPTEPSLVITTDRGPDVLEPGGPAGTWNLTIEYRSTVPTAEEVTLRLAVDDASNRWQSEIEPTEFTFRPALETAGPQDRSVTLHSTVHIAATPHAPAYEASLITIEAVTEPTTTDRGGEGTTQIVTTAGFRPGLEVTPTDETLTVSEGETVHARAVLQNRANGPIQVSYGAIDAPPGCEADPIHETHGIDRALEREAVLHLTCDSSAESGELAVTYEQAYAPDTSLEGPPVTQTWDVEINRSTAAETQAAVLGTSASVGGIPVAAWAAVLVATLAGGVRMYRER